MLSPKFRFGKTERLCKQKHIEELFAQGQSFHKYPFKILYTLGEDLSVSGTSVKVLLAVPKKKIRKAVKRNLLKRRMREAYRVRKHLIAEDMSDGVWLHLGIIYIADKVLPFSEIESAMSDMMEQLIQKL